MEHAPESDGVRLLALTPRELEVLRMTTSGRTNAEIATQLAVSVHAVKFHLAQIYRRLGVANRTEAAVTYLRAQSEIDAGTTPATQVD